MAADHQAFNRLSEAKIFIDDTPGVSIMEMRAKARRLSREAGLDLLMVDYLQLMRGRGNSNSRQEEISDISGRGVGMDAVRATIESLGGQVDVATQSGAGTTTTLTVPIKLSLLSQSRTLVVPMSLPRT